MVYAEASRLHADFRRALGREPGWGFMGSSARLRIYPLGAREANAWYDPQAGSLVFGCFPHGDGEQTQQGWASTARLATGGSGLLPLGAMHPDLLDELAAEAASLARRFMAVTVRALDFCPPSSLALGEYLRAMVTADALLVPDDGWGFREALIDAFRARRIFPRHVVSLTEDALLWDPPTPRWTRPASTRWRPPAMPAPVASCASTPCPT